MADPGIVVLVERALKGDRDAALDLRSHARRDPTSVAPWLRALVAAGVYHPPELYLGADRQVRQELVAAIDRGFGVNSLALNHALNALAFAGGDEAEVAFRRWSKEAPPGANKLYVPLSRYTLQAGWVLLPQSGRRYLCSKEARTIDVARNAGEDPGGSCPFCSSPLWVALDVDVGTEGVSNSLAHTGWTGRLRVVTCQLCSCYGPLFSEVDPDGSSQWSRMTERPSFLPESGPHAPDRHGVSIGLKRPSPYLASAWDDGGSTLGGFPDWIQDAEYLKCPRCGEYMDYVALLGGADMMNLGEGAFYVSLHASCRIAGTGYQQS